MALLTEALLKIEGKYPSIKNEPLWTIYAYNDATGKYDTLIKEFFPEQLTSSSIDVKHNAAAKSKFSLRRLEDYNELVEIFKTETVICVRNTDIRQWFVIDSASSAKKIDADSGIEMWSYDINLLDSTSLLDFVLIPNNQYVDVPGTPPEGYVLPGDYMKFAMGTGAERLEGEIVAAIIKRPLIEGYFPNVTEPVVRDAFKFKGLSGVDSLDPPNPIYDPPKTSWINTECGEVTVMDKMADMGYECPVLGAYENDSPGYKIYHAPNTITFDEKLNTKVMASYTAGFEHSENQAINAMTETYPRIAMHSYRTNSPTPYLKWNSLKNDVGDGVSYTDARDQIKSLADAKITKADIQRFIDTQITTLLKPYTDFILGDVLQIEIDDVGGFGLINLMVTEIREAIEDDAITFTLTLEELEDSYAIK